LWKNQFDSNKAGRFPRRQKFIDSVKEILDIEITKSHAQRYIDAFKRLDVPEQYSTTTPMKEPDIICAEMEIFAVADIKKIGDEGLDNVIRKSGKEVENLSNRDHSGETEATVKNYKKKTFNPWEIRPIEEVPETNENLSGDDKSKNPGSSYATYNVKDFDPPVTGRQHSAMTITTQHIMTGAISPSDFLSDETETNDGRRRLSSNQRLCDRLDALSHSKKSKPDSNKA